MYQQRYLITGGSGFIGTELIKQLLLENHDVTVLTRNEVNTAKHFAAVMDAEREDFQAKAKVKTISSLDSINPDQSFDVVINLAGQGIADKKWTNEVKQQLIDSRIDTTKALYEFLTEALIKPDVVISGSALGYYGVDATNESINENGDTDNSFSSQLCQQWEAEAQKIEALGIRTCYLRTGIVLGKGGGALAKMLPPFKMALGGPISGGNQWMSWIHMADIVGLIRYAIEQESIRGSINGTAPVPVTNKEFSKTLGKVLKRPAIFPMPAFVVKILFGQMGEELLLAGKRVVPDKMVQAGYAFKYADLDSALKDIV
ncbi:TIGR01777 family oxidoreductase [Cocleimonas sp. KMM 6892]|uniref:TIGR01777 family oxidoreductase n=1 Tax=unclassified Cocleimonas TaxID=2639732 RepID=UPI002DBE9E1D|nr:MULTISPECIES: TIGR01777 family oxidoreductase [unclassified Cocleimonas]MEB8432316.1 TIGR01777 family oxidoreductase [Cocleimonas sp. KMM 6892]MEC4714598.1 TIGR01777 family oxidoreductase [Cocleimonas sp. KMM 6895]MEC4744588.1 TIGR01777 family oxidoreductase [Cocleimonas sp. KMM 6896]